MAPAAYRQRINETVVKSGQAQLVAIYGRAMAGHETFDRRLYLDALKTAGDEDRLFESLREMKLFECLDLCKRWAEEDRLPTDARRRQAAEDAVRAYQGLGEMVFEEGPAPPAGLRDLFAVWKQASSGRDQRGQDLKAKDPLVRAKAIFLGHAKGAVNDRQLSEASKSDDWPVRLVARLSSPVLAAADDHVQWINALSGVDAELLQAPVLGTPVDYARYSERLAKARTGGARRIVASDSWRSCAPSKARSFPAGSRWSTVTRPLTAAPWLSKTRWKVRLWTGFERLGWNECDQDRIVATVDRRWSTAPARPERARRERAGVRSARGIRDG